MTITYPHAPDTTAGPVNACPPSVAGEGTPRDWLLVAAAVLALAVSTGPVFHFAFAVFIIPLSRSFAADRAMVSLAATFGLMLVAIATPGLGWITDRLGARNVVLGSIPIAVSGLIALALLPTDIATFILLYGLVAVASLGTSTLPYVRAITARFETRRGLALGCATAGIGLGVAILPPLAQLLIAAFGWRGAYIGIAALVAVTGIPALFLLPRERSASGTRAAAHLSGLTPRDCLAEPLFLKMLIAFMLAAFAMSGVMAHMVALLEDRGVAAERAAGVMSAGGITLIVGRVFAGYLADRVFAPRLALAFFGLPLAGLMILLLARSLGAVWLATGLIGLGIGAEVDLIAFMIARYFGLKAFGSIYGLMLTGFMAGNALGPVAMGLSHTIFGRYDPALGASAAALVIGACLMTRLGDYRYGPSATPDLAGLVEPA